MKKIFVLMLSSSLFCACSDNVETVTYDNESDTTNKSIDGSEIINDSSRLPKDTLATGVQH